MPDCKECKTLHATVPYVVYEAAMARSERNTRRFFGVIVLLIVLLVGSNLAWIAYESQFEDVVQTVEQEADNGTNNFVGGDYVGEAEDHDENP